MKKTIVTISALFLVILLYACSTTTVTKAGREEHEVQLIRTNIYFKKDAVHLLYMNKETKCMYTTIDGFTPIAEQEFVYDESNPKKSKCIGIYQDKYYELNSGK